MNPTLPRVAAIAATIVLPFAASAQSVRDLGAHEHGAATMNVVIDGSSLLIELESPWANLIGFEHAPSTDEQHAALDDALARLARPTELFVPRGGDCTADAEPTVTSTLEDDEHGEDHHDEHGDEHDDHGDEDHAGHDEESHSELSASYAFECADMASLEAIDLPLLSIWSGIEDIDVQLAGPGGQDAAELGGDRATLDLARIR